MTYEYYVDNVALARHPKKVMYGEADDATIEFVYKLRDDFDSTQVGSYFLSQPQRLTYIHLQLAGARLPAGVQENEHPRCPERAADVRVRAVRHVRLPVAAGDRPLRLGSRPVAHAVRGPATTQQMLLFDNDATDWVLGFVNNIDVKHYGPNSGDTRGTLAWTETVGRTRIAGTLAPDVANAFSGRRPPAQDGLPLRHAGQSRSGVGDGRMSSSVMTEDPKKRTWEVRGFSAGPLPDILAKPPQAHGARDAPRRPGRAGIDHGRQQPAHLIYLRRPRPRDLAHAPLGQRDDDEGRRHNDGGREDNHRLRPVRQRQYVRRGGGDGRRLRHSLFVEPR